MTPASISLNGGTLNTITNSFALATNCGVTLGEAAGGTLNVASGTTVATANGVITAPAT